MQDDFRLKPIGVIHSLYKTRDEVTGSKRGDVISTIELFKEYEEGLCDIDGFSHIIVITWLHRSEFRGLKVKPLHFPGELRGVFATRHPDRPNPIGLSAVQLIARKGNVLEVKGLDMLEGTPVIDIKPYTAGDRKADTRLGWLADRGI
jgi:tRNA-Thr(GGU) m(6)t(6)A37 methyltransferase TsaA